MSINYKLFFGVVEDIFDPKKLGRVRVRVHDVHSPYEHILKTKDLPWCRVLIPAAISASMSGIGHSNVSLLQGSLVAGFFIDESDKNEFIVLWSIQGIPQKHTGSPKGNPMFKDPDKIFPLEYEVPDFNRLAREIKVKTPLFERDKAINIVDPIVTSKAGDKWKEPKSRYNTKYPWNKVNQTVGNHIFELDDTPGNERINLQHRSLSYMTFHEDGSIALKDYKKRYDISKERRIYTDGEYFNTVKKSRYDIIREKWILYVKSFEITGEVKVFGNVKISKNLSVEKTVEANKGHFNIMEAKYSKTLAEVAVCSYAICIKKTSATGVSITVKGKVLIDTLSEAYELADLGVSNALLAQEAAANANTTANQANNLATQANTTANQAKSLAENVIVSSNKSLLFRGISAFSKTTPPDTNDFNEGDLWISNPNVSKLSKNKEWEGLDSNLTFTIPDFSLIPNEANLTIQSGTTIPTPITSNSKPNIWVDGFNKKVFKWDSEWVDITNVMSVSSNANIARNVKYIDGKTPETITSEIDDNRVSNLTVLNSMSLSKSVLDGSIEIFNTSQEPASANEGDLWVNGNVVNSYVSLGNDVYEWQVSPNSDKIYTLLKTYLNLSEYKNDTIKWFFQDIEPTEMKEKDMWYNDDTYQTKRYDGTEWVLNSIKGSDIKGTLENIEITSKNIEDKGEFSLSSSVLSLKGIDENDDNKIKDILTLNYDLLDEEVKTLSIFGNADIEKDAVKIVAHKDNIALEVEGSSVFDGIKLKDTKLADLDDASDDNKHLIKLVDGVLKISTGDLWKAV